MFNKKNLALYKFNLKVIKLLPIIVCGLVVFFGLVLGILDAFFLEAIIDLGAPFLTFLIWILISAILGALSGALVGVVGNAYLLHIYCMMSINNQLVKRQD